MSQLSKTAWEALYGTSGTVFPDNTTGEISEGDMRTFGKNLSDSVPFTSGDDPYSWARGNRAGVTAPASLKDIVTLTLAFGTQITFTDSTASNVLRTYELTNETTAESSPTVIRPNDYAGTTNEKVWRLRATVDVDSDSPGGTSIPFGTTSGTNTYTIAATPAVTAYTDGMLLHVRVGNSSTGVVTFNFDGLGAKKVLVTSGTQAQDGYLKAGVDYLVVYNSALDAAVGAFTVVNELQHGVMNLRGTYAASGGLYPGSGGSGPSAAIRHGDTWVSSGTDTIGSIIVRPGDLLTTLVDAPGQTASNWVVIPGYTSVALKENLAKSINTFTADHILALTDVDALVQMNLTGTANTVTFPQNSDVAIPVGSTGKIVQIGTGVTTIVQGTGATVTPPDGGTLTSPGQGQAMYWVKTGTNAFSLFNGNAASALTKTDDTNVILTLGGSPNVALLAAASITVSWSGFLAVTRGGTGADNTTQTYTPTLTNTANVAASTPRQCTYFRVGNTVTVAGQFDLDPTTTATLTTLGMSLPIASNFSTAFQAGGTAVPTAIADRAMAIFSDATNDRVTLQYVCTDVTNHTFTFTFTYQVI